MNLIILITISVCITSTVQGRYYGAGKDEQEVQKPATKPIPGGGKESSLEDFYDTDIQVEKQQQGKSKLNDKDKYGYGKGQKQEFQDEEWGQQTQDKYGKDKIQDKYPEQSFGQQQQSQSQGRGSYGTSGGKIEKFPEQKYGQSQSQDKYGKGQDKFFEQEQSSSYEGYGKGQNSGSLPKDQDLEKYYSELDRTAERNGHKGIITEADKQAVAKKNKKEPWYKRVSNWFSTTFGRDYK